MSNIIDKILVSGVTYDLPSGGSGSTTVELTQAEYDALVSGGTVDPDTYYIITDATPQDMSQYWTSAQTNSAITQAVSGKQDTLIAGDNITISGNVISASGGGSVTVDSELSTTSENPVQNKVVTAALNGKGETLQWDATSTARKDIPLRLKRGNSVLSQQALQLGDYLQYGSPTSSALCITGLTPTSAITSSVTSASTDSQVPSAKAVYDALQEGSGGITSGEVQSMIDESVSGKQDTLSAGTNITITDNVISAQLEGGTVSRGDVEDMIEEATSGLQETLSAGTGIEIDSANTISCTVSGKTYSAGTNISIDANDAINCTIPYVGSSSRGFDIGSNFDNRSILAGRLFIGDYILGNGSGGVQGRSVGICYGDSSHKSKIYGSQLVGIGYEITMGTDMYNSVSNSVAIGNGTTTSISDAVAIGYQAIASGTTKTNINNQLKIDTSNQVYIYNKDNTEMICLQDHLGGGGKAISGGTNISVTTGETADTISCTLPITATSNNSLIFLASNTNRNITNSIVGGNDNDVKNTQYSFIFGQSNTLSGITSRANIIGYGNKSYKSDTFVGGIYNKALNQYETDFGVYNNSVSASTTFGDSGNTLFSVGNGTANNARHNAFEIRQNGDIYLTKDGQDVKLQDQLGGGGGGGVNVVQTTGTSTTDVMSQDAVTTQLSGYVTTDTLQDITGNKTFIGGANTSKKPIIFKQANNNHKIGFSCQNSASTNNELATFEFRPNTFTIDGVQHPLLYFGHYRTRNIANAGVPQTVIGFRQYDQPNAAAYHYLMPLPEKAKTPFSLTTSFKDYYAPMGFKNGSTMITADDTGVVDLSSELDGLKLKKLTQAEYDALTTKDDNTVYFIGDSNGYTMKIGNVNVN